MRIGVMIAALALALAALGGCKKKDEATGGGGAATPPPAASPPVDCAKLLPKMKECADPFWTAFAETGQAKTTGGGDAAKGVKTLRDFFDGDMAEQMCKDMWGGKDARWNARYNACWAKEACADWAPCMADALGNLLPAP
jgi:hypothetical protein